MKALLSQGDEGHVADLKAHTFDTGSKGFVGFGKCELEGHVYTYRVQMIDKESVPPKDVRLANKAEAIQRKNDAKEAVLEAALAKLRASK